MIEFFGKTGIYVRDANFNIILVTHNIDLALAVLDELYVLEDNG